MLIMYGCGILFCILQLQFSFRSKEKSDKKYKNRLELERLNEGSESNDSDQSSKVASMSDADIDRCLEQMLVSQNFLTSSFFKALPKLTIQKFFSVAEVAEMSLYFASHWYFYSLLYELQCVDII